MSAFFFLVENFFVSEKKIEGKDMENFLCMQNTYEL